MIGVRKSCAAGIMLFAALAALVPISAQSSEIDDVFEALLDAPEDPDLMLRYARLAIAERDYEAALATLERLIDIEPDSQEARFELAIAYFALGINSVAEYHLDLYVQRGQLTQAERARAARYRSALSRREDSFSVRGRAEAGVIYRSETQDRGATATLSFNLRNNLSGSLASSWRTRVRAFWLRFPDEPDDDRLRFVIRSGPSFAIAGTAQGTRIQPYIGLNFIEDGGETDTGYAISAGVLFRSPISQNVSVFVDAEGGRTDRTDGGFDNRFMRVNAGASWQMTDSTRARFTLRYRHEDEDPGGEDIDRYGGGLSIDHETAFPLFGEERDIEITGFARYARENSSNGDKDEIFRFGANIRTYLSDDIYLDTGVQRFTRSSSDPADDDEDTIVAIGVGWEF